MSLAVGHLAGFGHRRIGLILNGTLSDYCNSTRKVAFERELARFNLESREEFIAHPRRHPLEAAWISAPVARCRRDGGDQHGGESFRLGPEFAPLLRRQSAGGGVADRLGDGGGFRIPRPAADHDRAGFSGACPLCVEHSGVPDRRRAGRKGHAGALPAQRACFRRHASAELTTARNSPTDCGNCLHGEWSRRGRAARRAETGRFHG